MARQHQLGSELTSCLPKSLSQSEHAAYSHFFHTALALSDVDKASFLTSIPLTNQPSSLPLNILSKLLTSLPGQWPVFPLLCTYAKLWKHLPEASKSGRDSTDAALLESVARQVRSTYSDLPSLFPTSDKPAIQDATSPSFLSHQRLSTFLRQFRLPVPPTNRVVAIALPNGPLLGLALLATVSWYTAAPVSVTSGPEQFRSDVLQSGAKVLLVTRADIVRLGLDQPWVEESGITIVILDAQPDFTFTMSSDKGAKLSIAGGIHTPNGPDDAGLILFTSGTSGAKKVVPMTVHSICSGVAFVIESWGLSNQDVCSNMMPLFHVGGIIRNLFAPILAGGSTICCPAFDPNLFWDVVEDRQPTWYYASPTMHSAVLEEGRNRPDALSKSKIRLICNAAGGLLPSLACALRETFHCTVLPSYGMTECMPISTPPLNYKLDRPGTSGISVGPDMAILDGNDNVLPKDTVGRIAVRGAPVFEGYKKSDGSIDTSPFTADGWFDTGDMGYLDGDGYLYVTGRSKEVINRGGELISPFEVEEAVIIAANKEDSPIYGRVSAALAFSMPHAVLQEVVGLAVVTPPGARRICIKTLREAIKDSLNQVKWPSYIVFMDGLPKNNNKVLRIKLAERLGLQEISDEVPLAHLHAEAECPPPDTPLKEPIKSGPCSRNDSIVSSILEQVTGSAFEVHIRPGAHDGYCEAFLAPYPGTEPNVDDAFIQVLDEKLRKELHDYEIPSKVHCFEEPFPRDRRGTVDLTRFDSQNQKSQNAFDDSGMTPTEGKVARIFAQILMCDANDLNRESDFFQMGGDSLRAGRLVSELRREFQTRLPIDLLFAHGQVGSLAQDIDQRLQSAPPKANTTITEAPVIQRGCTKTRSSTNPFLLLLQLFPLVLMYPMKRAMTWTVFMYMLTATQDWATSPYLVGRLFNLIVCLGIGRAVTRAVAPIFGLICKWLIIGKYREGVYPMWGSYHTRWWLVQKILQVCGRGHFGATNTTLIWYYRMLGMKIGKGVKIAPSATLAEYDLITIEDGANLDKSICRGFAVEQNTSMYLGRIHIGRNSSVGLNGIVAPGTTIPDDACIGPNSSSWEAKDADEANRELSSSRVPGAHFLLDVLLSLPIAGLITLVKAGPWIGGLIGLVKVEPQASADEVRSIIDWFAEPNRIGYHYLALVLNSYFGPMFWFAAVFLVKKLLDASIGKLQPSPAYTRGSMQKWKMSLMKKICSVSQFHKLLEIFGSHYEFTSILYRAMGAKVGSRVYWPGTGPSFQDFDLLDIGNDVVFGSRAHIVTSDGLGSDTVRVGNGAMIADRVVLLPGSSVGNQSVLGSGALTKRNQRYAPNTVWIGSKCGEAVCLSSPGSSATLVDDAGGPLEKKESRVTVKPMPHQDSNIDKDAEKGDLSGPSSSASSYLEPFRKQEPPAASSPFGRAFYEGKAPYRVYGLGTIFLYSSFITVFTAFYWNVGTTSSIQVVARVLSLPTAEFAAHTPWRPVLIYALFTASIAILMTAQSLLALGLVIAAKWILLGRRQPGNYDWDKSPYCQRWQLFLSIEKLRRHCYGNQGILGLLTGTHYAVLYFRALGAVIGKDCALFAGGLPSLMFTEPDLLTLGERVAVDDASLVSHINSRGVFNLNRLSVGDRSVLRSGSRLLSGAHMGADSVLLEHTLVMAGDVADEGCTYQGWPADAFHGSRMPTVA